MRRLRMFALSNAAAATLVAAVALTACGDSGKPPSPASATKNVSSGGSKDSGATAEVVAKEARGKLQCPARLPPAPAAGSPIDDVLGVRPGIAYEEAWNAVLCTHELLVAAPQVGRGFDLKAPEARSVRQGFGAAFAEARVVKSSKEIMKELQADAMARGGNAVREDLKPGQSRWFVSTMGVPGQERVISVAREERFAADQSPTIDATVEALLKKYGTPSHLQGGSGNLHPLLRWAYDPQGQLVKEGAPLFHRCQGTSDPNGSLNLVPDCGRVVQALLVPQRNNPALVDRLQVGVVDQGGGYNLIVATEQALGQTDQERRAREVEKASKNAKAPTL
jgi:hypothetical protein